jgi:hypothetical protein
MAQSIDTIIQNSRSAAVSYAATAGEALSRAEAAAGEIQAAVEGHHTFRQTSLEAYAPGEVPTLTDVFVAPVGDAERPELNEIILPPAPSYPTAPTINVSGLFEQSKPNFSAQGFTEVAPEINIEGLFDDIATPHLATFEAPAVSDIVVGDAPELNIPEFTSTFVDPNIAAPADSTFKTDYDSILPSMRGFVDDSISSWISTYAPNYHDNLAALEAKISTDMQSGQALSAEFETSLYNRARARVEAERIRVERTSLQGVSKRGFTLPSSVVSAGLQDSQKEAANNIAQQSTELAIERAKIEIQHVQFVMQLSQGLTQTLVGASMSYAGVLSTINGQALDYSKQIAAILSDIYRNMIERGKLSIDVYKAEITLYETELKSALANLDGFKLELEAARLEKDIDAINVDIYSKQIQAEGLKIQQYASIIKASSEKASLEKIKVDLFGEQVKAFAAETKVKEIELSAYVASLKGDEALVKGELAKLSAYTTEIEAEKARLGVEVDFMKASDSHNRSAQAIYATELGIHKANIDAETSRFSGSVEANKAALYAYTSDNNAKVDTYKVNYDKARLDLDVANATFNAGYKVSIQNAENVLKSASVQASTSTSMGQVYGSMASSALSSLNTMASKSATE